MNREILFKQTERPPRIVMISLAAMDGARRRTVFPSGDGNGYLSNSGKNSLRKSSVSQKISSMGANMDFGLRWFADQDSVPPSPFHVDALQFNRLCISLSGIQVEYHDGCVGAATDTAGEIISASTRAVMRSTMAGRVRHYDSPGFVVAGVSDTSAAIRIEVIP